MSRRQKESLRPLTADERAELEHVGRAGSERADRVARAKALLAVADGARLIDAAGGAGRRSRHAVAHLVARFNTVGLAALDRRHGGGPATQYGDPEAGADPAGVSPCTGSEARWDGDLVAHDVAAGVARGAGWPATG